MESQQQTTVEGTESQQYNFGAEISQLLSIIINTFYSNKEIFLRELISNASDAIDKVRYQNLQNPEDNVLQDTTQLHIRVIPDLENKLLVIEDTGVGMTHQDLIDNLGTIAHSGTKQFMENLNQGGDMSLIGKFGVGFYSAFLVADKVDVYTRHYSEDKSYVWSSTAQGSYTITESPESLERGTRIVLHLRDEQLEYLQESRLREIISKHSQFISYPIYLRVIKRKEAEIKEEENEEYEMDIDAETEVDLGDVENKTDDTTESTETEQSGGNSDEVIMEDEDMEQFNMDDKEQEHKDKEQLIETFTEFEVLNKSVPIWMKNKTDVSDEEYNNFYKTISQDWDDPMTHIHFKVEGDVTFKALLYVPKRSPFDMFRDASSNKPSNIKLYVRRVFITDNCEQFIPDYMSFVKGVIDSDDLPLNISREMLQHTHIFNKIKRQLVKKVIDMLNNLSKDDNEKFEQFYNEFSRNIKLGVHSDNDRRQKLATLLRYRSTKSEGKLTSLDNYISNMKEDQHDIYYLSGENLESVASSTHLDIFHKKNIEVIFMTEAIDEYCVSQLNEYNGHKLVNITRSNIDLPESDEEKKHMDELKTKHQPLCDAIKKILDGKVSSVVVSNRLINDPCCISVGEHGWSANMEKIMKAQAMSDQSMLGYMKTQRCFELNPNNNIVKSINDVVANTTSDIDVGTVNLVNLLYETALQDAGFTVASPRTYAHRVYSMVELGLGFTPPLEEQPAQKTKEPTLEEMAAELDADEDLMEEDELPDLENASTETPTEESTQETTTNEVVSEESTQETTTNEVVSEESTQETTTNEVVSEESTQETTTNEVVSEESTQETTTNEVVSEESCSSDCKTNSN